MFKRVERGLVKRIGNNYFRNFHHIKDWLANMLSKVLLLRVIGFSFQSRRKLFIEPWFEWSSVRVIPISNLLPDYKLDPMRIKSFHLNTNLYCSTVQHLPKKKLVRNASSRSFDQAIALRIWMTSFRIQFIF